ncbi:Ankyrin repeat-containing protein, putative isoform 1 [Hibiscus syriacus]|uniref:Ankyrin repeat-containing protein, putative isoform 1 n=1 Tax=Hibiscus syriacus TaxID=106335 RepID=A0A6A2X8N0_HIBSY|nr:Ankyrin repeat-containing protein, putative isoform 1 [Hibiscus syriacus]
MACDVINSWTFTGLVGAFLDLFIAYILLCGSAVAYFASKILGLFGLSLPCPCNGLFGYRNKNICVQSKLVNDPSIKISSVQSSVMRKIPFDSIWKGFYRGGGEEEDADFEKWRNCDIEMGGEASSSSWHEKGSFVSIPKGPWGCLRRRERSGNNFDGNSSFLYDPFVGSNLNFSASVDGKLETLASTTSINSQDGKESLKELKQRSPPVFEIDDEPFAVAKKELAVVESQCGSDKNSIRVLEQALDEEHAGRTALYLELEKERIAASTAADEAMAMILRLQEEKAAIEMEAKQYQRMIEEKAAFDAEEMNILKEILLRREREKLFLEKEVEAYKQMFFDKDQSDTDVYDMTASQEQITSYVEPVLMLEQFPQSILSSNQSLDFGKELLIPVLSEDEGSMNSTIEKEHKHPSKNDYKNLLDEEIIRPLVDSGINRNVLDVHVVNEDSENRKDNKSVTSTSDGLESEPCRKRNSSDRSGGLPPLAPSQVKSLPLISRRNSMSAFDYEKYKIDNEVGLLRERLRIIQHGREKLNIPTCPKEREQSQKQTMENIANQLREIRQLSVPGKALRQASLPSPSSKDITVPFFSYNLIACSSCMISGYVEEKTSTRCSFRSDEKQLKDGTDRISIDQMS